MRLKAPANFSQAVHGRYRPPCARFARRQPWCSYCSALEQALHLRAAIVPVWS